MPASVCLARASVSLLSAHSHTRTTCLFFQVGVLICFDVEFPEPARCLALAGATLLIVPTALGGGGSAADVIPLCCVPTRAMENHVAIL